MAKNVLVVCEKNLFRSKLLATFLVRELKGRKDVFVWSRGVMPSEIKGPLSRQSDVFSKRASELALKTGLPELLVHGPKHLTNADIQKADLVLGVTDGVVRSLKEKFPESANKVFTAKRFAFPVSKAGARRMAVGLEKAQVEKLVKKKGLSREEVISMPKSLFRIKSETQRLAKHIVRRL